MQQRQLTINTLQGPPPNMSAPMFSPTGGGVMTQKGRLMEWNKNYKINKKLNVESQLKNYEMRKDSGSYLLSLKSLSGLSQTDATQQMGGAIQGAKYSLEYYVTLFNRDIGSHGGFYGRTFRSKAHPLKDVGGTWDLQQEEFIYFHTNYVDKSSMLVVECVLVRDIAQRVSYSSAGFAICDLFQFKGVESVDLTKGTPRSIGILGLESLSRAQRSGGRLTYELRDYPQFDKVKGLVPQNCFIGFDDIIPGLVSEKLPHPRAQGGTLGKQIDMPLIPRMPIYIHQIQLMTSVALESRFENFLRRMKQEVLKTSKAATTQEVDNVYIDDRRIIVQCNNTWRNVTDDTYVSMSPPNQQGISSSGGSLMIKNYICHRSTALIFRIEYKAIVPIKKRSEQIYFTIGWNLHLPAINQAGELSDELVDVKFTLGPGNTPAGDMLWDPNADDTNFFQVRMKAFVSTNATPPVNANMNFDGMPQQQQQPGVNNLQSFVGKAGNGGLDPQAQMAIAQKEKEYQMLQQKYADLQRKEQSMTQHAENLEIRQLNKNTNSYNQQPSAYGGGNNRGQNDPYQQQQNLKQALLEKQVLEDQMNKMRLDVNQYMGALQESNYNPMQQQPGYGQQQQQQPVYGQQTNAYQQQQFQAQYPQQNQYQMQQPNYQMGFTQQGAPYQQMMQDMQHQFMNSQIMAPLSANSQASIASIGNVFYNMLNLIGEKEKDKRIIALSEDLKKLMQSSRVEDLLGPKVPYIVGQGKVNLLKTTDLPQEDQARLIRDNLGDMLKHPSASVKSDGVDKSALSMEMEAQDNLQSSTVSFKFICMKTPWTGIETMPKRFFFSFKFFTFPAVKTAVVQFKNPHQHSQEGDTQGIKPGYPYYLSRMTAGNRKPQKNEQDDTMGDPNMLSMSFTIDPSISRIKKEHLKLSNYLFDRFLTVDVFDADSMFLYSTCKIPLFELLRQTRGQIVRAKECEMCEPESGDFRGALQLIMSNVGHTPSVTVQEVSHGVEGKDANPTSNGARKIQPSQGQGETSKSKKVVKSSPMDLTKMQQTNNPANTIAANVNYATQTLISQMTEDQIQHVSENDADLRKKLRVDRVRKMTMGTQQAKGGMNISSMASVEDPMQPDWMKLKSLREIEMIRATKKKHVISRVMEEYVSGVKQLSVIPGEISFVRVKIFNHTNHREVFTANIIDPDEKDLTQREFSLVTDKAEWRYWVSRGKAKPPQSYDFMTALGDVMLEPKQECEILFKFLTLRDTPALPDTLVDNSLYITPRKVSLIIMQSNKQPYSNLEVNVVPCSAPVDHIFRFYEPQNSHVTLFVPPFIQLDYIGLNAVLSKPLAVLDIDRQTGIMQIQTKTDDETAVNVMTLFVYGDQYKSKLLATCQLEVHSMVTIYTRIKAGLQSMQNLALPAENARSVQIHSSNPQLVYLPSRENNRTFRIIPQTINHIQVCAKTFLPVQQKVRIHCTDVVTGELVHNWLLIIDAEQPTVTRTHEVIVKMNHVGTQQMEFASRLNARAVFEFASSDENLLVPKLRSQVFEAKEMKLIDLHFPAQLKYGTTQVYLYANDMNHNVVECFQLVILCVT